MAEPATANSMSKIGTKGKADSATLKKYLFLPEGINRFGYVPRCEMFRRAVIKSFGSVRKGQNDYCFITFESGETELSRYDEKGKRWAILCFPSANSAPESIAV